MFDMLIKELATKFGLGDKAMPLVQLVLAYMTNKQTGGLPGFMEKFASAGFGDVAQSWLGGAAGAKTLQDDQIAKVLGGNGGLLSQITGKLNLNGGVATSALGFLLPAVIGKLSPGGKLPSGLPSELSGLLAAGQSLLGASASGASAVVGATGAAAGAASGGLMKWLPWIAVGAAALFALSFCSKKAPEVAAPAPAVTVPAPAPTPAPSVAAAPAAAPVADPVGSAVVVWAFEGSPALKVFFDSGKTQVAPDFAAKAATLAEFLKTNAGAKAVISGFNDPTGDPAKNAELSKSRAQAVQSALAAVGVANEQTLLEKPSASTDASTSNAAARRVEVVIRK